MTEDKLPVAVVETLARAAVAVLVPYGGAGVVVYDAIRGRLATRMQQTAEEILTDVGPEVLTARLAESSELEALLINALDTAARTGYEAKRRLLGRVVINAALGDDAQVDESVLIEMALRDIEGPHVRALVRLQQVQGHGREASLTSEMRKTVTNAGSQESAAVLAALIKNGLTTPATLVGGGIGVAYVTDFGSNLLTELR